VHGSVREGAQRDAVRGWERALADLESAATEYNPDGLPIAIEGLKLLASYLEVVDEEEASSLKSFSRVLRRLARDNEGFEDGPRTKAEFDRWAPSALEAVSELRSLTQQRLKLA